MIKTKSILSLGELLQMDHKEPQEEMLWSGIKQGSFGFVFGPSKSGKTIFTENMAMSIAAGKQSFFNEDLKCANNKVLFISLEEFWRARAKRQTLQLNAFNEKQREIILKNYMTQNIDFPKHIISGNEFDVLKDAIEESEASVVIIDSLSRFGSGQIEDSKVAKEIVLPLRDLSYDLGITTMLIHHSTKSYGKVISMESMAGSRIIAQEADFLIGIAKSSDNTRYLRKVAFRYAPDDYDTVTTFTIDNNCILNIAGEESFNEIASRYDGRFGSYHKKQLFEYVQNSTCPVSIGEIMAYSDELGISKRTVYDQLKNLKAQGYVENTSKGMYKSTESWA